MDIEKWLNCERQFYDSRVKDLNDDPRKYGTPYSITITLNPVYTGFSNRRRHKLVKEMFQQIILPKIQFSYLELHPELTKAQNIHYHGVVFLVDLPYNLRDLLKAIFGRSEVTNIKHDVQWYDYIKKEDNIMKQNGFKKIIFHYDNGLDYKIVPNEV